MDKLRLQCVEPKINFNMPLKYFSRLQRAHIIPSLSFHKECVSAKINTDFIEQKGPEKKKITQVYGSFYVAAVVVVAVVVLQPGRY